MDMVPIDLTNAAALARDRLAGFARSTAFANTSAGSAEAGNRAGTMAGAAREAIFADALLAALHARLQELKGAAR